MMTHEANCKTWMGHNPVKYTIPIKRLDTQMTWPPQSLDLNPIEMIWDELDRRVKEKQPTSVQHMWELLQDCWKSIPGEAG